MIIVLCVLYCCVERFRWIACCLNSDWHFAGIAPRRIISQHSDTF